ncbi:MAG: hypothetical protein DME04_21950 [Candidatus Rokuibacteriota bacterium]|nr:MAG: hypothetical protein DME04_21950 [Candidatus Rokubacteria bacterium]
MRYVCAVALAMALIGHSVPGWAGSSSSSGTLGQQAGYGAGSALGTIVYAPFKASFCILGGVGSAVTAIVSRPTAGKMVTASCGGTWIISPDVLQGHEKVHFVGESAPERAAAAR